MIQLKVDTSYLEGFVSTDEILAFEKEVFRHRGVLMNRTGAGSDFLGWIPLPGEITEGELLRINDAAARLRGLADAVVVIGIGGSYLGARAVIEALQDPLQRRRNKGPEIVYAGHQLSEDYLHSLMQWLDEREVALVVISKSGTTTEPAIAFRLLRAYVEGRYGRENARDRIVAITDRSRGALRGLADQESYESFAIPDDVGGRYSVLTPVGLLPIAAAGWDIEGLVHGARAMEDTLRDATDLASHPAGWYAAARNALYRRGKAIEVLVNYEPYLGFLSEWWKQLYGESEGKQQRGIFPASVSFTTDLHSMGQYLQDGMRVLFETVLSVKEPRTELRVPFDPSDVDGLNFLSGMRLSDINAKAEEGTLLAHIDGGVPNIRLELARIDEPQLGELIYFYEMGCAISGYILEVNPFDQPGVEDYKRNMFALLGKPGFEAQREALLKRLK